jgi:hypothetical protein
LRVPIASKPMKAWERLGVLRIAWWVTTIICELLSNRVQSVLVYIHGVEHFPKLWELNNVIQR